MRISTRRDEDRPPEAGEEPDPEEEAERMWDTRGEGRAGFGYLMQLLAKQGTHEAEAAIDAIQLARARWAFRDPPPKKMTTTTTTMRCWREERPRSTRGPSMGPWTRS